MYLTAEEINKIIDNISDNSLLPAVTRVRIKKLADEVLSRYSNEQELEAKYALFLSLLNKIN